MLHRWSIQQGDFLDLVNRKNIAAGLAPTAGQMPRALGLALASKLFRETNELKEFTDLSHNGDEVCFCTIGDAATSEGHFWETVNAAAVLQVPLVIFVWDDGYGISVPKKYQTTKGSISEALKGFQKKDDTNGLMIYKVKAWDYAGMCELFEEGIQAGEGKTYTRSCFMWKKLHSPRGILLRVVMNVIRRRIGWNGRENWDCIKKMREWIIANMLVAEEDLIDIEHDVKQHVRDCRQDGMG